MKPVYLRYRDLVNLGACDDRKDFKERFGLKPVLVTATTAVANARFFDFAWISQTALNQEQYNIYLGRINKAFGSYSGCCCTECDPDGVKKRFMAQAFAEGFIAQGGVEGRTK